VGREAWSETVVRKGLKPREVMALHAPRRLGLSLFTFFLRCSKCILLEEIELPGRGEGKRVTEGTGRTGIR
jgi:hypothetical protein